jgi:ActR/RegA family two-component response regulator
MKRRRRRKPAVNARALALAYLGVSDANEVRLRHVIARHIDRVLEAADGNRSVTAQLLGIDRRTMQRHANRRSKLPLP